MTPPLVAIATALLRESLDLDHVLYRAFAKFHRETECGHQHMHWAECDAAITKLGYDSWEHWTATYEASQERRVEKRPGLVAVDGLTREKPA